LNIWAFKSGTTPRPRTVEKYLKLNSIMNAGIKLIIIPLTFLFAVNGFSQKKIDIGHQIDSLLQKEYKDKKFNGNILVVQKNKTLYEKSFGFANPSRKDNLNKDFKFQIGSIYKEFVAVAVMQLYEKGLIHLEDDIHKYIPELPVWSKSISIKNLLQYSSGLPEVQWAKYFNEDKNITFEEVFEDLKTIKTLNFKPGSGYLYTNYSPLLLMKLIENITHQDFSEYAKQNLFDSDDIVIKEKYPYTDRSLMAIPFDSKYTIDSYKMALPILFASNVRGLYNWFDKIHSNKMISQKSKLFLGKIANILTDEFKQSPLGIVTTCQKETFGLPDVIEHTHDGSNGNYQVIARRFNNNDLSIIILTNQKNNNLFDISESIYKIVTKN